MALRIREIGAEHGVPLLEAPPLARTLYRFAELEDEIPGALYNAVAEVLAYVYQLNRYREVGGSYPVPPRDLPIPQDMMVEAAEKEEVVEEVMEVALEEVTEVALEEVTEEAWVEA